MNQYVKDALWGAIGGLAGTFVLGTVMAGISKVQSEEDKKREQELVLEPPTEKLARRISENVLGMGLENETKTVMGKAIQLGYGIFWGGVYGILRKRVPAASWAGGLPFGVSFGLFGEALLLPLMDLTPPAHYFPASKLGGDIVSHWAYAATVESVCRAGEAAEQAVERKPMQTNAELRRVS